MVERDLDLLLSSFPLPSSDVLLRLGYTYAPSLLPARPARLLPASTPVAPIARNMSLFSRNKDRLTIIQIREILPQVERGPLMPQKIRTVELH